MYTLFRCNTDQKILAENLMTVLMAILGLIDEQLLIEHTGKPNKWMMAGGYEPESGLFFLRKGEPKIIQAHFKLMSIARLQQKSYSKKVEE